MTVKIIVLIAFLIEEIIYVPVYMKNGGANHKVLTSGHIAMLLIHAAFLLMAIFYPGLFEITVVNMMLYFSWLGGALLLTFNSLLVYKMSHQPIHADIKMSIKEFSEKKEKFNPVKNSITVETEDLFIIFPEYRSIKFYDYYFDARKDENITFSGTAAFHKSMIHPNTRTINGPFMAEGKVQERTVRTIRLRLGAFVWDGTSYHFYTPDEAGEGFLKAAGNEKSIGFSQMLLIHDGKVRPLIDIYDRCQCFRVIAEFNGELCIIECKRKTWFTEFLEMIYSIGLANAIYIDMGTWMNVSWYRNQEGKVRFCFPKIITRPGNQIMFSKEE